MKTTLARLTAASAIAVLTLSAPLAGTLFSHDVFAKDGNGGGHGGGNGGGHSGGNGGGHSGGGNGGSGHGSSKGSGESSGKSGTHRSDDSKGHVSKANQHETEDEQETEDEASTDDNMGPLNAAHASATARQHAAPNSAVGKIAAYEQARDDALSVTDETARQDALDAAVSDLEAAFGRELTDAQVSKINGLLDRS